VVYGKLDENVANDLIESRRVICKELDFRVCWETIQPTVLAPQIAISYPVKRGEGYRQVWTEIVERRDGHKIPDFAKDAIGELPRGIEGASLC